MSALVRQITGEAIGRRHRRVLVLIANGHTSQEIADELGITLNTANFYSATLLARIGAHDRAHAVALGLRHGYITLDDVQPHPELPIQEAS